MIQIQDDSNPECKVSSGQSNCPRGSSQTVQDEMFSRPDSQIQSLIQLLLERERSSLLGVITDHQGVEGEPCLGESELHGGVV